MIIISLKVLNLVLRFISYEVIKLKQKRFLGLLIVLIISTLVSFLALNPIDRFETRTVRPWMKEVSDDYLIKQMSIPGTHDSGATHSIFDVAGKCQDLRIQSQLNIGVRFFDLRLQLKNDELEIVHSFVNQKLYFADVINAMIDFVKEYDSEFLIISLKEEASSLNSTKSFEDVLASYLKDEVFDKSNILPQTLKDARGKIYILSRMDSEYGIQAYNGWQDSTTFMLDDLYIQDNYSIDEIKIKKEDIIKTIEFSKTNTNYLVINFTSCYLNNAFPPTYAGTAALEINPWFNEYISNNNDSLGIIVMDFISQDLAQAIYRRNIR